MKLAALLIGSLWLTGAGRAVAPASRSRAVDYAVTRIPLPGEGRGDYLLADPRHRRLYVTHSSVVHILDLETLKPLATVRNLAAAHGVALDPRRNRGFVTDGKNNRVVMFDPATGAALGHISTGKNPDSVLYDPASGMILAFDGGSDDVSVIDPARARVVRTIKLPYAPEFSQTDGHGRVWVNLEEGNSIAEIDTRTMKLVRTIALPGCDGPAPLAFDPVNRLLFSGCGNRVMIVADATSGEVVATVPIGGDPDGIAYDPGRKRIFVANRDGGWTVIDQKGKSNYSVGRTIKIDEYAKTIGLDPRTHRLFSSSADLVWPIPTPGMKRLPNARSGSFRLIVVSEQ